MPGGGRSRAHPRQKPLKESRSSRRASRPQDGSLSRVITHSFFEKGPFDVHVARAFPLEQVADAHRALGEHYLGKLVLRVG